MRAPQERTMRDLYDRTRHKDLPAPEEPPEGRVGGRAEGSGRRELVSRMEGKTLVRKKSLSGDSSRVKVESGTCNVCYAPCTSCQHQSLERAGSNVNCGSSQTCSTRSEVKNNSLTRNEKGRKGVRNTGENEDEVSAASSNGSYSETGGNKVVSRSPIAEDASEVDMPVKRRRLSKEDRKPSRAEYLDDNNSCVTGTAAEGKLPEKKKLTTSASSRDLTVQDSKDDSIGSLSRLRTQHIDESTEKNRSDAKRPSSSIMTKKLLRTQSSVSVSKGLSPKRQAHELGDDQQNLSRQRIEKASLSNNIVEQIPGETPIPCVDAGDNNDMLTGVSGSTRNERKAGISPKILESDASFSKDQIQQRATVQTNDDSKRNGVDKQDRDQDSSMDISNDGDSNMQNDVMTDCATSEGLIDVDVCDICGDVGREYLLARCTRCHEGAEHTYCMRVKLDKVPDGEWLCEECQLKDKHGTTRFKYDVETANISEGKKQSSESQNNNKVLRVFPDIDTPRSNCNTPTADQSDAKNKKLHLSSADTLPQQVKVTNPAAERLEMKGKNLLSMTSRKKLQVVTSDLEARSHTGGIAVPGSSNKKNQSSEFQLNHKKLRVSTDMESPLSSEGLRSPPISCKRPAENTSSFHPRLLKANSAKNRDVFCHENSFKKSSEGSVVNTALRNSQAVKSSQALSRSYSMGNMVNAKAAVTSPRAGLLSKQLSFNNPNKGPKVKQLAEGFASKLRPAQHSPKESRDQGPTKKLIKSGSFKSEGSVCKDVGSSKQKQSFHVPQDEKTAILKSAKEKNMMERRPSFNFKKPNIPSSPRPDSSVKPGERKLDQDTSRPGPSILKTSKRPGNLEKERSELSKTDNLETSVHQRPTGFVSGKDIYAVNIPDPPVPSQCVKRDSSNDDVKDSFITMKDGNGMPTEPHEVLPAASGSDFPGMVERVNALEELASKVVDQQKPLERTANSSCKIVEETQPSDGTLSESPHGLQIHNGCPSDKLDKPNSKQEAFLDQSTPENPLRHLVIPEESYIWQGSFEVSRHGILEIFDGIQAYLSTCASFKVCELGKQLPHKIQVAEVPRHSSWPLQFKEVNPTEDNIGLFFFAKDAESYERAYRKLLDDMLLGDLSLTANIDGTELLIFPSDKLPEKTQRWNGLLFFWGIFYARKARSLPELPVTGANSCPIVPVAQPAEPVIEHDVCSPKVLQSLVIDLNECPVDDLSDPAMLLGSEMEKSGASTDQNIGFNSKHEDRKLNVCEIIHDEETAGTRQIVSGHPTATPCETLFRGAPPEGAIRLVSGTGEMVVEKQALQPSVQASPLHFSGSKISDGPTKLIPKSGIGSSDFDSGYKRQKTSHGKDFGSSFEELPSKCFSKIYPLPAAQLNPFDDAQYIYRDPPDPDSHTKPMPDNIIHVLSSDDEDSPEPSTSLNNKASLKADAGSSPLLSLSLSTAAAKPSLAGSDIGEDEPLSLSLGLPSVVEGSRVLEMKQFLPEKPGINT